jgi:hypothetical protein
MSMRVQQPPSPFLSILFQAAWPIWVLAWGTTAVGRVLGDAHWVSDTLAGGCLGLAVTSVLAIGAERLMAGRILRTVGSRNGDRGGASKVQMGR